MQSSKKASFNEALVRDWAARKISAVEARMQEIVALRSQSVMPKLKKVLEAFSAEKIGPHHFTSVNGYGHGDAGREAIDRVFARVLGAECAAVRLQFVSGTHAIASALFGVLRPGDSLLSVTGKPYETLEEVIGLRKEGQGSLSEFGVHYEAIDLLENGSINFDLLDNALTRKRKVIFIQRSCGYAWRPSLSISLIKDICKAIHNHDNNIICFVDNCYGEFVESLEPTDVGADLIAGSLIKNLGGTIVPTGGYIAGRSELVEKACCRLTAPGIGLNGGTSFDLNRVILQGLFLSPQMVTESLIGADLIAGLFEDLGYLVQPLMGQKRSDLIQCVQLRDSEALQIVCKAFQATSPVGSYLTPVPSPMSGYSNDLLMAGGTFIDGSTSEFSADAPLKPPFNLFIQGGTHRAHIKLAVYEALVDLVKAGIIEMSQNV